MVKALNKYGNTLWSMVYLVKDVMSKKVVTIDADTSVATASKTMAQNPRGYAIALEGGQPAGIVTERDVIRKVLAKDLAPGTIKVSQIMSSPLVTIDPDEELTKAAETMKAKNVRKLPVVREGILYGIITARDIVDHFTDYVDKATREILVWTPYRL
jgi:CBS domain-containing protein